MSREVTIYDIARALNISPPAVSRALKDNPRVSRCGDCISVIIDNHRAGYGMTTHLISQGCRRIVHLGGSLINKLNNLQSTSLSTIILSHSKIIRQSSDRRPAG